MATSSILPTRESDQSLVSKAIDIAFAAESFNPEPVRSYPNVSVTWQPEADVEQAGAAFDWNLPFEDRMMASTFHPIPGDLGDPFQAGPSVQPLL